MASIVGMGNLRVLSPDEARKQGRKGGVASAEARRAKRDMAETLNILLRIPMKRGKVTDVENIKSVEDLKKANLTVRDMALAKLALRAINSDSSFALLRDQIGETPVDAETMRSSAISNLADALAGTTEEEADGHIDEVPP